MRCEIVPKWSLLRRLGNSWPAKASILIPLIGFLIINEYTIAKFAQSFAGDKIDVPSVKFLGASLYFLYCGLFIFGLGSICFQLASAPEIKIYDDINNYIISNKNQMTQSDAIAKLYFIKSNTFEKDSDRNQVIGFISALENGSQLSEDIKLNTLSLYYKYMNERYVIMRILTCILMVFGVILISMPSVFNFAKVIKIIYLNT